MQRQKSVFFITSTCGAIYRYIILNSNTVILSSMTIILLQFFITDDSLFRLL